MIMQIKMSTKTKNKKPYICKHCEDTNLDNFIDGRYTSCKKCTNKKITKSVSDKSHKEILKDVVLDKDTYLTIEKFMHMHHSIFDGNSLKNAIAEYKEEIRNLKASQEYVTKDFDKCITKTDNVLKESKRITKLYSEVCTYNTNLTKEIESLKLENESLNQRLTEIEKLLKMNFPTPI
jgi:hypothetical protein